MSNEFLKVNNLTKCYKDKAHWFKKGKDVTIGPVSFGVTKGETIAIVGEAGSGKSTVARLLSAVDSPDSGELIHNQKKVAWSDTSFFCKNIRLIFQDALKSLNPTIKIGEQLEQPLIFNTELNEQERQEKIHLSLRMVGLLPEHAEYYPHMFSGGQAQRISIARALILDPEVVIIDEALAPLDPSLRAQVINLLLELQQQKQLTYILISHHISLIKYLSDRVLVMDNGKVIEQGKTVDVFTKPSHNKTKKLINTLNM